MNDLDADEAQFLARARRGLGPSLADRQRIAAALAGELGSASALRPTPKRFAAGAVRAARWAGLAGLFALGGGLGYWRGYRAGSQVREVVTVVRSVPAAAAAPSAVPVASAESPLPSAPEKRAAPSPSAARVASPRASASAANAAAHPVEALGLDEEVRQLRRIEKAIREGNPRFALVLLDELDTAIPAGQLLEERQAARVMADCQLDAPSAQDRARAFATEHAQSAYVTRALEMCGLPTEHGERISPAPGTNVPR